MSHPPFRSIGLIGKHGDPGIRNTLERLIEFLGGLGRALCLERETDERIPGLGIKPISMEEMGHQCDLAMVVGGDGTLLHAAAELSDFDIALLGINMGRLGFLADVPQRDMNDVLVPILNGEYDEERRFLLDCEVDGQRRKAFNDVVIHKWNIARLIEFETHVDGRFVNFQRSDGLIISSPTGSTAYALSGGGPLVHPDLDAILLVPICPHTLSNRPIMVAGNSTIEIRICGNTRPDEVRATCDGQGILEPQDGVVRISKYPHTVRLIHPRGHDYFYILRNKLGWSEEPRHPD
jgi:NAD+ kinase